MSDFSSLTSALEDNDQLVSGDINPSPVTIIITIVAIPLSIKLLKLDTSLETEYTVQGTTRSTAANATAQHSVLRPQYLGRREAMAAPVQATMGFPHGGFTGVSRGAWPRSARISGGGILPKQTLKCDKGERGKRVRGGI